MWSQVATKSRPSSVMRRPSCSVSVVRRYSVSRQAGERDSQKVRKAAAFADTMSARFDARVLLAGCSFRRKH